MTGIGNSVKKLVSGLEGWLLGRKKAAPRADAEDGPDHCFHQSGHPG
jgi:hypothetical protein